MWVGMPGRRELRGLRSAAGSGSCKAELGAGHTRGSDDAVVEAINQAMQESQKAMQTTMMDMQKELMSTLQAQQKK